MKIQKMFKYSKIKHLFIAVLSIAFLVETNGFSQPNGEALFKANCASCHHPVKNMTGPGLQGSRERWEENSSIENMYAWVKNSQAVIASGDSYAKSLFEKWNKSVMTNQAVSNEEIDAIMDYADSYVDPVATTTGEVSTVVEEKGTSTWLWWVISALLLVVIFAVSGVKKELGNANKKANGVEFDDNESFIQGTRRWLWENFNYVFFFGFIIVISLLVVGFKQLNTIGVFENYKPEQPIQFSHEVHAGKLEIACFYCHNSVENSKTAGIPSVNVCMNCHKTIHEGPQTGTEEIAKIHEAAGFDASVPGGAFTGVIKPIKWVKVHNMPDHVYFNHSQHVVAGGLDCKQCHGDMTKETVARVMTTADLNAIEENTVKFTRPTLTMGWCIECHGQKEIDIKSESASGYYKEIHNRLLKDKTTYQRYLEDGKVTVAELGGWECAKCHY